MSQVEQMQAILIPHCNDTLLPDQFNKQDIFTEFKLSVASWDSFPYKPVVSLKMGWNRSWIFLHFTVHEKEIRGWETTANGKVWEDSCVEFFIAPDQVQSYYNFEFNCIGTCLLGYGTGRENRIQAPIEVIKKIYVESSLGSQKLERKAVSHPWTLMLGIPPLAFFRHSKPEFTPGEAKGNFYKCGDGLKEPHFVSWRIIKTVHPDFHQPEYFGAISLV